MSENAPLLSGSSLESGVQIGDFRIERRLGAGGMGIVYQAKQVSLNRPVALKVLGQALTRDTDVTRFQREAQAAARLRHPAIAQVYFIGQDRHLCFMAMELIEGISLRKVLDRLGNTSTNDTGLDSAVQEDLGDEAYAKHVRFDLPTEGYEVDSNSDQTRRPAESNPYQSPKGNDETFRPVSVRTADQNPYLSPKARELRTSASHVRRCCEVARDAALALVHAHEQGVVHRDIKPDNLLLDRKGQVHLIDFGVARFFDDQSVTYTGQLVGTPLYMSPEQVSGRGTIDARTDVYSLGLVLYELLTLRPSVEATNRENLLRSIITKPLPPLSWRNAAVSPDLERIVHRATQKDPDERYAGAADLAADLDRYLTGKPVTAPPYRYRLDKREITAARPGGIVLAAFILFMTAFFLFVSIESVAIMMSVIIMNASGLIMAAIQTLFATAILAAGVVVGRGILAGHGWARWSGVGLAALLCLCAIMAIIGLGTMAVGLASGSSDFQKAMEKEMADNPPAEASPDAPDAEKVPSMSPMRFIYGMVGMYALPGLMALLLGGAALYSLLSREAFAWFRFARQIRAEHRQLRHELG